ncbi:hypothetical protein TNCV_4548271 [Trichonephila clavipes]|nr:hypothetical protein TNCV_4548271 [Trichonephila clavipes]
MTASIMSNVIVKFQLLLGANLKWCFSNKKGSLGKPGIANEYFFFALFEEQEILRNFLTESGLIKERDSGKLLLVAVHNSTQTLMEIIMEWIEPGTTTIADCWKDYNHDVLTTEGFNHLTFNHSVIQIRALTQILLKARGGT